MNYEEIYEKAMGHAPVTDGTKGMFDWQDIKRIMIEAQQQVKSVDLADVGGSLITCKLLEREDVMFGKYKLTSCCKQGPVTQENYCPNCGAKIERQ